MEGKEDGDDGAVGFGRGAGLDADLAAVAFNELLGDKEADPGSDGASGSKEGFEDVGEILFGDAAAVVGDGEQDAGFLLASVLDGDAQVSAGGQGVDGVGEEVGDNLHDLAFAKNDRGGGFDMLSI